MLVVLSMIQITNINPVSMTTMFDLDGDDSPRRIRLDQNEVAHVN